MAALPPSNNSVGSVNLVKRGRNICFVFPFADVVMKNVIEIAFVEVIWMENVLHYAKRLRIL
jgi:hypothetical protein